MSRRAIAKASAKMTEQQKVSFEANEKEMEDMATQQIVPKKASNKLSRKHKASEKAISTDMSTTEADEEEDAEMPATEQEGEPAENEQGGEVEEEEPDAQSAEDQHRAASRHFTELSKSAQDRAGVKFPISKLAKFAKSGKYAERIGQGVPVFMAGVLEYLTFEILELASNKAGETSSGKKAAKNILPRHIMLAVKSDEEFSRFLKGAEFAQSGRLPTYMEDANRKKKKKGLMDEDEEDADFDENEDMGDE